MKFWFERGAWASKKARRRITKMDSDSVRRIVVIRHAALGDMVLVRPFIVELRKMFPSSQIVLSLVSNYVYGAPLDLVDDVHILPGSDQRNISFRSVIRRYKELDRVDLLFDLADTSRSRYLSLSTRAMIKFGFPYRSILRYLLYDAAVWRSDYCFEAQNMMHLLMLIGGQKSATLNYGWGQLAVSMAYKKPYVIYFPFASKADKCWPRSSFLSLVAQLAPKHDSWLHVFLSGSNEDESAERFIEGGLVASNVAFQPKLDLERVISLIAGADLVVSNDTGVRNLAIALGVPTVGIFFSTVPYRYMPENGPNAVIFQPDGSLPRVEDVERKVDAFLVRD
jgi:ADP-heptose:LPS heptosyltransferase